MKQTKFLLIAFALLAGISLTSCLDSNDDYEQSYTAIVKVNGGLGAYSFKTADGSIITPSLASISSLEASGAKLSEMVGKVAYIIYTTEAATVDEVNKRVDNATLKGGVALNETVEVVNGTEADHLPNDSTTNAPIITLNYQSQLKPCFVDETSILLPIQYTLTKHQNYFTLVYHTEEPEDNNGTMRLHLRYHSTGKSMSPTTSYTYLGYGYIPLFYKAYDLTYAFMAYMQRNGLSSYPTKIEIVTKESEYSTELGTDTQTNTYTVEYGASLLP